VFKKCQGLGGHTSKAHPGLSKNYERKMMIRNNRTEDRHLLEEAKKAITLMMPEMKKDDPAYAKTMRHIRQGLTKSLQN